MLRTGSSRNYRISSYRQLRGKYVQIDPVYLTYAQSTGYITWECPTVYIAQKLPLAKHLYVSRPALSARYLSFPDANILIWGIVWLSPDLSWVGCSSIVNLHVSSSTGNVRKFVWHLS